jgi:quercetin dioxygenase-like cupin family protein
MTITPGKVVVRDDVEVVHWAGERGRFLLRDEDTGGLYTFFEIITPPGGGPPPHVHDTVDEAFYVVEGEYEIRLDGQSYQAPSGTLVYGPRGVAHEFRNVGDGLGKLLCVATPAGVERFFEGLSALFSGGRPEWGRLVELAAAHKIRGFRPQGGPLAADRTDSPGPEA